MGASLMAMVSSALLFQAGDGQGTGGKAAEPKTAAEAVNAFAADLLRESAAKGGNFLASPLSLELALAMARVGARGETAAQMDAALHLPPESSRAFREATR